MDICYVENLKRDIIPFTFVDKKLSNATKSSQKQYEKFSLALVDLLPKQLIDKIGVDILGVHNRLLNPKSDLAKKVLNKLAKKKDSKEELPFNVEDVRLFQSGSALMNSISTNILFKDFATAQEKEDAYQDKYLEEVLNANAANKAVLEYLITQITKAVGQDISLLPGYIRYLESNANLGKGIRALSGLASIEFYADSQAPFINIKTGQGYRGINAAQKA